MEKLTEKACLEMGGHCWNRHSANDVVDEFGKRSNSRTLVYYPNGEPQYRTCKHCGKRQWLKNEWRDSE